MWTTHVDFVETASARPQRSLTVMTAFALPVGTKGELRKGWNLCVSQTS
jgi:hypothetical protein